MYTAEYLKKYPFFEESLQDHELSDILDSLTGMVARPFMLDFVKRLIADKIPFTFAILDLDNFKFINDNYGHKVGDGVLQDVAAGLMDYVGEDGICGRFGGDEYLFIHFKCLDYDAKKLFLLDMYMTGRVLRKNVKLMTCDPFITGTIGCATYPTDANSYDGLFALIDKTLYRGKTKGRNCYIIYVEEKHKDIKIDEMAREGLYHIFHRLALQYDMLPNTRVKLMATLETLQDELRISDLYYIGADNMIRCMKDPGFCADASGVDELLIDDIYTDNDLSEVEEFCPELYKALRAREIETVLIIRVAADMQGFGCLVCAEPRNQRIWQEDECAILFFAARMLAGTLIRRGETL